MSQVLSLIGWAVDQGDGQGPLPETFRPRSDAAISAFEKSQKVVWENVQKKGAHVVSASVSRVGKTAILKTATTRVSASLYEPHQSFKYSPKMKRLLAATESSPDWKVIVSMVAERTGLPEDLAKKAAGKMLRSLGPDPYRAAASQCIQLFAAPIDDVPDVMDSGHGVVASVAVFPSLRKGWTDEDLSRLAWSWNRLVCQSAEAALRKLPAKVLNPFVK